MRCAPFAPSGRLTLPSLARSSLRPSNLRLPTAIEGPGARERRGEGAHSTAYRGPLGRSLRGHARRRCVRLRHGSGDGPLRRRRAGAGRVEPARRRRRTGCPCIGRLWRERRRRRGHEHVAARVRRVRVLHPGPELLRGLRGGSAAGAFERLHRRFWVPVSRSWGDRRTARCLAQVLRPRQLSAKYHLLHQQDTEHRVRPMYVRMRRRRGAALRPELRIARVSERIRPLLDDQREQLGPARHLRHVRRDRCTVTWRHGLLICVKVHPASGQDIGENGRARPRRPSCRDPSSSSRS